MELLVSPTHQHFLKNGLKLIHYQDTSNPIVCIQLYIKTGSIHENFRQRGYAHFIEHLVFRSTIKYPDNQISDVISEIGASINAYTDFDSTCFYVMMPSESLAIGMEVLSQIAFNAIFNDSNIELEKGIILEEIHQCDADPEIRLIERIQKTYFRKSTMKYPVLGTKSSIMHATRRTLSSFYKKHYSPSNSFLVVSGDFCPETLLSLFEELFADWTSYMMESQIYMQEEIFQSNKSRFFAMISNTNDSIAIAIPELNESHPESEALHIAIRCLAIGKSSVLYKKLIEGNKLCSSVKVSSLSCRYPGISIIQISPIRRKNIRRIIEIVYTELIQILMYGVESIEITKREIINSWLYSFQGVENIANLLASEEFNGDVARVYAYSEIVNNITTSQIKEAIAIHWNINTIALYHQGKIPLNRAEFFQVISNSCMQRRVETTRQEIKEVIDFNLIHRLPSKDEVSNRYYEFALDNGLRVVYNFIPNKPICGFALSSPLSQLCELKKGVNFFTSTLLLHGSLYRSHDDIVYFLRERGSNIRVLHHTDSTTFRGKCFIKDIQPVIKLLAELVYSPLFDPKYFNVLRASTLDSIRRERDYPQSVGYKKWFDLLFGKDNNLFRATGTNHDINHLSINDIHEWYSLWNLSDGFCLCLVGSMPFDEIREIVSDCFGSLLTGHQSMQPIIYREFPKHTNVIQYTKSDQAIINMGGNACSSNDRVANSAFHILSHIIGGDLSSRMYSILREKHGLAYQTGFDFSSIHELGYWNAFAYCNPTEYKTCVKLMHRILDDIVVDGVLEKELNSAKNYLVGTNRFDQESVSFKASSIANLIALGYDIDFYTSREDRIRSITLPQIKQLVDLWLGRDNRYTHILV